MYNELYIINMELYNRIECLPSLATNDEQSRKNVVKTLLISINKQYFLDNLVDEVILNRKIYPIKHDCSDKRFFI